MADCIPCEKTKLFKDERFLRIYPEQIDNSLSYLEKMKIQEFLNYYRYIVDNISEKLGKTIHPLIIEGDEVYVDPKKLGKWADTLIHIFRNALDHGIETIEERIEMNKPQYGQISVKITDTNSDICIEINDDGRGIEIRQIAKKAVEKGLINPEQLEDMKKESLLEYIFIDGFSTKNNVDLVSGRGAGLSAVKNEWEKLGGTIQVLSEKDKGTTFVFTLLKALL